MAGTYGSGTYGGGDYGSGFGGGGGGSVDLGTITGSVVFTGTLPLGGGGAVVASGSLVFTGTLPLSGGTAIAGPLSFAFSGSVTLGTVQALWPETASISFAGSLDLPPRGTDRRWIVVTTAGVPLGELENAVSGPITWSLNKPVEWSLELNADDPKAELVHAQRFREVQAWRGDQLLTWGPIVRPAQDVDRLTVQGRDCLWYFGRRHIGKAERTNHVVNPSLENGLASWSVGYLSPAETGTEGANPAYVLGSVSTLRAVSGRYSGRAETPNDTYPKLGAVAYQGITWLVDAAAKDGDEWTASVQLFIPSATLRSLGGAHLGITRYDPLNLTPSYNLNGVFIGNFPTPIESVSVPITPDFPLDKWERLEARLQIPPTGAVEVLNLEIHLPKGVLFWDDARLTYNERLEWFATDQATIAAAIVSHLQDTSYDKSALNIGTNCPATGVLRDATYLFEEHLNGLRTLEDFTKLDDGFDHRIDYTPTTRTYTVEYPASGRWRPNTPLHLNAEVTDFQWTFDGELAASAVVTLGSGRGSGREEGYAGDATAYANGLILEEVFAAPPGAPVATLDNLAAERLAVTTSPEILEFKTPSDPVLATKILGGCRVGDVLPVVIQRGELQVEGTRWRLVRLTLHPDDSLSGTLNRRDVTV